MIIKSIGMGEFLSAPVNSGPKEVEFLPEQKNKTESIMKLQQKIVEMQNEVKFIKQTEDVTPLWKFNHRTRLNIV
jgi:hypothetical protein